MCRTPRAPYVIWCVCWSDVYALIVFRNIQKPLTTTTINVCIINARIFQIRRGVSECANEWTRKREREWGRNQSTCTARTAHTHICASRSFSSICIEIIYSLLSDIFWHRDGRNKKNTRQQQPHTNNSRNFRRTFAERKTNERCVRIRCAFAGILFLYVLHTRTFEIIKWLFYSYCRLFCRPTTSIQRLRDYTAQWLLTHRLPLNGYMLLYRHSKYPLQMTDLSMAPSNRYHWSEFDI